MEEEEVKDLSQLSLGKLGPLPDPDKKDLSKLAVTPGQFQIQRDNRFNLDVSKYSPYLENVFHNTGLDEARAQAQTGFQLTRNALGQAVTEVVGGTLEGASYLLDFEQMYDKVIRSDEKEYTNWFAQKVKSAKEGLNEEMPIYTTREAQEGFAFGDATWWASNGPSIASSLSLLIPAAAATKLAGAAAKGLVGAKRLTGLSELLVGGTDVAKGLTMATFSRYAENTMEASQTFDATYNKALQLGFSDEDARLRAGQAATDTWNANRWLWAIDALQFGSLMKGLSSVNKGVKGSTLKELLKQMPSEGAEEIYQAIAGKEAERAALSDDIDFVGKGFQNRLSDYLTDPQVLTAGFFGALGGGVFTALGGVSANGVQNTINKLGEKFGKQEPFFKKTPQEIIKRGIAQTRDLYFGDNVAANVKNDLTTAELALNYIHAGKEDELKGIFKSMSEDEKTEPEMRRNLTQRIEDIDFLIGEVKTLKEQSTPDDVKFATLVHKLEHKTTSRNLQEAEKQLTDAYQQAQKEGLRADLLPLKQLKMVADIWANTAAKYPTPENIEKAKQAQENFEEQYHNLIDAGITLQPKELTTPHDSQISKKTAAVLSLSRDLEATKDALHKLTTPEGQKAYREEQLKQLKEREVENLVNKKDVTKEELQKELATSQNTPQATVIQQKLDSLKAENREVNKQAVEDLYSEKILGYEAALQKEVNSLQPLRKIKSVRAKLSKLKKQLKEVSSIADLIRKNRKIQEQEVAKEISQEEYQKGVEDFVNSKKGVEDHSKYYAGLLKRFRKALQLKSDEELNNLLSETQDNIKQTLIGFNQLKLDRLKGLQDIGENDVEDITLIKQFNEKRLVAVEEEILARSLQDKSDSIILEQNSESAKYELKAKEIEEAFTNNTVKDVDESGKVFTIYDQKFVNLESNPLDALKRDDSGNIVSATLTSEEGKTRTFRNPRIVDEIAFAILSTEVLKQGEREVTHYILTEKELEKQQEKAKESRKNELVSDLLEIQELIQLLESDIQQEESELLAAGFTKKDVKEYIKNLDKTKQLKDAKALEKTVLSNLKKEDKITIKKPKQVKPKVKKNEITATPTETPTQATGEVNQPTNEGKTETLGEGTKQPTKTEPTSIIEDVEEEPAPIETKPVELTYSEDAPAPNEEDFISEELDIDESFTVNETQEVDEDLSILESLASSMSKERELISSEEPINTTKQDRQQTKKNWEEQKKALIEDKGSARTWLSVWEYEGEGREAKIKLDEAGNPIPAKFYDNTGVAKPVTEIFLTDESGKTLWVDIPGNKAGQKVVLQVVDDGMMSDEKRFKWTKTFNKETGQQFRPTGPHNWVINAYLADNDGNITNEQPIAQLPSEDSPGLIQDKDATIRLRRNVINSPNGRLVTNSTGSNVGDIVKSNKKNVLSTLEFDYHLTEDGKPNYSKTPFKPILAAHKAGKNDVAAGLFTGGLRNNPFVPKHVKEAIEYSRNNYWLPVGDDVVPYGGIYTYRMNPEGNYRAVKLEQRSINQTEKDWLKNNLQEKLQSAEGRNQLKHVVYLNINNAKIGGASGVYKALTKQSRNTLSIVVIPNKEQNNEVLIPVTFQKEGKPTPYWGKISVSSLNDFINGKDVRLNIVNNNNEGGEYSSLSQQGLDVRKAFENTLSHLYRNVVEQALNTETPYKDLVTNQEYPSYYNFLNDTQALTTSNPTDADGTAYSGANSRLRLNPDPDGVIARKQDLVVKEPAPKANIGTTVKANIEAKKADIERRRQEELKERVVYDRRPTVDDGEFKIIGDPNNRIFRVNENTGRPQVLDESNGLWSNTEESPNLFFEIVTRSGFQKSKDKINAKYDAELKALEEQSTSAKKADIEIGKVGNTEYEVKVDGVYYQGKKLNNPENKTHRQLIEADIERRRQEELNETLKSFAEQINTWEAIQAYTGITTMGEALDAIYEIADKEGRVKREQGVTGIRADYKFTEKEQKFIDFINRYLNALTADEPIKQSIQELKTRKEKAFNSRSDKNRAGKINVKYDAELAALEKPKTKADSNAARRRLREKLSAFKPAEGFQSMTDSDLQKFKDLIGEEFVEVIKDVDRIYSLKGDAAFGIYYNGLIKLAQLGEKGTERHEQVHFMLDMLYTSNQKEAILNEAAKVYGIERSFDASKPQEQKLRAIDYALRAVDILKTDKADKVFRTGDKNNWSIDKILTELAVPKEQKELIKSIINNINNTARLDLNYNLREEIITSLLANYSYAVEINTTKENKVNQTGIIDKVQWDKRVQELANQGLSIAERRVILEKEFNTSSIPTQHYSNLTVPGGTNYTENEIATPAIVPSIKGHAQFSTDNGIGWFRSDEQDSLKRKPAKTINEVPNIFTGVNDYTITKTNDGWLIQHPNQEDELETNEKEIVEMYNYGSQEYNSNSKTRRILEVQSDLFQKGRLKEDLILSQNEDNVYNAKKEDSTREEFWIAKEKGKQVSLYNNTFYEYNGYYYDFLSFSDKYYKIEKNSKIDTSENQFLQLLNKDNNWVTFFVKSIIQDSAKKGYEKVLFPSGNTASKVEGHSTLEEFKKQKETRIKELNQKIENSEDKINESKSKGKITLTLNNIESKIDSYDFRRSGYRLSNTERLFKNEDNKLFIVDSNKGTTNLTKEELENIDFSKRIIENETLNIKDYNNEINQLKQELERVETEGFGALKPIYNFYENTVTNILKKVVAKENLKTVVDEYGNSWLEITVTEEAAKQVKLKAVDSKAYEGLTNDEKIEEELAEDARRFFLSGGKMKVPTPKIRGFFNKLWAAIKKLIGLKTPIQKLFRDMNAPLTDKQKAGIRKRITERAGEAQQEEMLRALPNFAAAQDRVLAIDAVKQDIYTIALATALEAKELGQVLPNQQEIQAKDVISTPEQLDVIFETLKEQYLTDLLQLQSKGIDNLTDEELLKYETYLSMGVPLKSGKELDERVVLPEGFEALLNPWEDTKGEQEVIPGFKTIVTKGLKTYGFTYYTEDKSDKEGEEDNTFELAEEDKAGEHIHGQKAGVRNPKDQLSTNMKLFLASIPSVKGGVNILGKPNMMNPNEAYSNLKTRLANSSNPLAKLEELAKQGEPISKATFEALNERENNGNTRLKKEFYTTFSLAVTNYKTVRAADGRIFDSNRGSLAKKLPGEWRKAAERVKLIDEAGKINANRYERIRKKYLENQTFKPTVQELTDKLRGILTDIGVVLPETFYNSFKPTGANEKQIRINETKQVNKLKSLLFGTKSKTLEDFLFRMSQGEDAYLGHSGLERLAFIAKDFLDDTSGDTFLSSNNNQMNPTNIPTGLSEVALKAESGELVNTLSQDPLFRNNTVLEYIEEKGNLEFVDILEYKDKKKVAEYEKRTPAQSLATELVAYDNNGAAEGYMPTITPADKAHQFMFLMKKIKGVQQAKDGLYDVLYNTLLNEKYRIALIKKYENYPADGSTLLPSFLKNYGVRGKQFLYIPEANGIPGMLESINEGDVSKAEIEAAAQKGIKDAIDSHIEVALEAYLKNLEAEGLITRKGEEIQTTEAFPAVSVDVREVFYNTYASSLDVQKILMGDIAFYKSDEDYSKRAYQISTPGWKPYDDPANPTIIRTTYQEDNIVAPAEGWSKRMASWASVPAEQLESWYGQMNKTDASSFGTIHTMRKRGQSFNWTDGHEAIYQFAWKKNMTVGQAVKEAGLSPEQAKAWFKLANGLTISGFKPFLYKNRLVTLPEGEKMIVPEQVKDAVFIITPELASRHAGLGSIYDRMTESNIDVYSMDSTFKVGLPTKDHLLKSTEQKPQEYQIRENKLSEYKDPQLINPKVHTETSASQLMGLTMTNIDSSTTYDVPGIGGVKGDKLNEMFEQLKFEKIKTAHDELLSKLGLDSTLRLSTDKTKRDKQIKNIKAVLQEALDSRDMSPNYQDAVELILNEFNKVDFAVHPGFPVYSKSFIGVFNHLLDDVLKQKFTGFDAVNFSDPGITEAERADELNWLDVKDGELVPADVAVSIDHLREVGIKWGTHTDLKGNILWDSPNLSQDQKDALQVVVYRIPTSGAPSITPSRIAKILPAGYKGQIMLSKGFPKQQGLDFDKDDSHIIHRKVKGSKVDNTHIDTKIFNTIWAKITNRKHAVELLKPLDIDIVTDKHTELSSKGVITKTTGITALHPVADKRAEFRNKESGGMIGIAARFNKLHTFLQHLKKSDAVYSKAKINIYDSSKPGYKYELGNQLTSSDNLISEQVQQLMQAILDNAKDPKVADLNWLMYTAPTGLGLVLHGVDANIAIDFLRQPVITEWLAEYNKNGRNKEGATQTINKKYNLAADFKLIEDGKKIIKLDSKTLGQFITPTQNKEQAAQVLSDFLHYTTVGSALSDMSAVFSVDTFKSMNVIEQVEALKEKQQALLSDESLIQVHPNVFNVEHATSKPVRSVAAYFKYAVDSVIEFNKNFFPETTGTYVIARLGLKNALGLKSLDVKTKQEFNKFLNYYVLISDSRFNQILDAYSPDAKSRWRYTAPNNGIWDYTNKQINKHPELASNAFIKALQKVDESEGFITVGLSNTNNRINKENVAEGWRELLKSTNPEIRQLGHDYIRYAIITSGIAYSTHSFFEHIPVEFWVESGIKNLHQEILNNMLPADGSNLTAAMIDPGAITSFIRHKYEKLEAVPEVKWGRGDFGVWGIIDPKTQGSHVLEFKLPKDSNLKRDKRRESLPDFVKIKDGFTFRLYEQSPTTPGYYKELQPLGEDRRMTEVELDGRNTSNLTINKTHGGSPNPFKEVSIKELPLTGEYGENPYITKYLPTDNETAESVIDRLLSQEKDVESLAVLNALKKNVGKINTPIQSVALEGKLGVFEVKVNELGTTSVIKINPLGKVESDAQMRVVLTHELNHAYSVGVLDNPVTEEEKAFARNIERVYKDAKAKLGAVQGTENKYEFLATLASDKSFREKVRKAEGLWERITRYFRNLLGLPDKYSKLMNSYFTVLDTAQNLQATSEGEYALEEKKGVKKDVLDEILKSLKRKVFRLKESLAGREAIENAEKEMKLLTELAEVNRAEAIIKRTANIAKEVVELEEAVKVMKIDPIKVNKDALHGAEQQIVPYTILRDIRKELKDFPQSYGLLEEKAKPVIASIDSLLSRITDLSNDLQGLRLDYLAKAVNKEFPDLSVEFLRNELEVASRDTDVSWWNHMFDAGIDANDAFVQYIAKRARTAEAESNKAAYNFMNTEGEKRTVLFIDDLGEHKYGYETQAAHKVLEEYEKWRGNAPFRDKFAPLFDKKSFKESSTSLRFIAPNSEEGKRILSLKKGDKDYPLKAAYETVVLGWLYAQKDMPYSARPMMQLPSIGRSVLEAFFREKGVNSLSSVKEGLLNELRLRYDESDFKAKREDGTPDNYIPVRYISNHDGTGGRYSKNEISLDIFNTVGIAIAENAHREALKNSIAEAEMIAQSLKERKIALTKKAEGRGLAPWLTRDKQYVLDPLDGSLATTEGADSYSFKLSEQIIKRMFYGEFKESAGSVKVGNTKVDLRKATDLFLKYTGMKYMLGSVAIPLTNMTVGKLTMVREALGGNIIDMKDLAYAEKYWAKSILPAMSDVNQRQKKTKEMRLLQFMNPVDSHRPLSSTAIDDSYMRRTAMNIVGSNITGFEMISTAVGAVFNRFKVTNKEGKEVPFDQGVIVDDKGKISLEKGFKYKGKSELNHKDVDEVRDYIQRLYQVMHGGAQGRSDSPTAKASAIGSMVLYMRDWLRPGILSRWQLRRPDRRLTQEGRPAEFEGNYISSLVMMNNILTGQDSWFNKILRSLKVLGFMSETNPEVLLLPDELKLSEEKQQEIINMRLANMRKTRFELYIIAGLTLLLALGWDDDEDDSYAQMMLTRVRRELLTFASPFTAWDVLRSPSVAMGSAEGIMKAVGSTMTAVGAITPWSELEYYQQGAYKDMPKYFADFMKVVPGANQLNQFNNAKIEATYKGMTNTFR